MSDYKQVLIRFNANGKNDKQVIQYGDQLAIEHFLGAGNVDCFNTINPLKAGTTIHKNENVLFIENILIDIDIQETENNQTGITLAQYLIHLSQNEYILPFHEIRTSGRGLHIIYKIDKESNITKQSFIVDLIAEELTSFINEYDPLISVNKKIDKIPSKRYGGIFRTLGSVNSRNGKQVKTIAKTDTLEEYSFYDIFEYFSISEEEQEQLTSFQSLETTTNKPNLPYHFTEIRLFYTRTSDLDYLQDKRNKEGILEGYRSNFLFVYAGVLRMFEQDTIKLSVIMNEVNNSFKKPLKQSEVNAQINKAIKRKYKFRNKTIIDLLDIDKEEEQQLKTIISKEEKLRRDKEYQRKKKDSLFN